MSALFSLVLPAADWLVGAVDVVSRCRPGPGVVLWCGEGLPCFMVSLWMVCPVLRPRPRLQTSLSGPRILPTSTQQHRPSDISSFRGSFTRLSISQSTLHAAVSDDDARLAYSAALLAFWRGLNPLGRRCGVSCPFFSPQAFAFVLFVCLCHLFFLVSALGRSPPPCLCTAPCVRKWRSTCAITY